MNYMQSIDFLFGLQQFGVKLGLGRTQRLMADLGNPQHQFKSIHVAGTNGKGSVTAIMASILREADIETGMYTSPHLIDARERIRIDNRLISKSDFAALVTRIRPVIEDLQCTYFEATTALAFLYFAESMVEWAVVEVGLGGRLDATNVLNPSLTIITSISADHVQILGASPAKIAGEKAGIIKNGTPLVLGPIPREAKELISEICSSSACKLYDARVGIRISRLHFYSTHTIFDLCMGKMALTQVRLPLAGPHQIRNCSIALKAVDVISKQLGRMSLKVIKKGIENVKWAGRFEKISENPLIIVDVAHNLAGIKQLTWMLKRFFRNRKIILVIGVQKDKDYARMAQSIHDTAKYIYTVKANSPKAMDAESLALEYKKFHEKVISYSTVQEAMEKAMSLRDPDKLVCIAGSHFVVGEALKVIKNLTN